MHPSSPRRLQDTSSPRRARRAWTLPALTSVLGLTVLVLAQACTTRTVVGVDVGSLEVQPGTATVVAGGDLQFTAVVKDDEGVRINGAIASWSSSSPSVLSIGADGAALALQEGTATVQASFQGVSGTATVTVQPGPEIVASPSSVALFGAVGGASPDPAVVQITNGGAGTLAGLSATVEYEAGGATGWLSPALDGTTAPTNLTLSASPGTLSAGTYNATIVLAGQDAANSPVRIPVLFSLTQGAPIIKATPATLAFNAPVGSPTPEPVAVQITNGGGGGLASLTASIWYESATTGGWLSGVLSGTTAPTELTISVDPSGLAPGIYAGEVRVASPNAVNSPQPVIVTLSISTSAAGFSVSESGNGTTVSESGSTDDFTVVLDVAPASDVVFNISSADPGEARVNPASLTFTPANWDTPKTVTVRGVDDTLLDGNQSTLITVAVNVALSNDAFDGLANKTVRVTTTDNDSPGFSVQESGGSTQVSESGTTDDFTVVLNVAPGSGNVVFTVVSDDTDEATVDKSTLTFTTSNWNTPQTVTVTGVNDALPDGDQVSTITISVDDANSNDAYDPLADKTVDVTTTDDDTAGFTVSKTAITLAEGATDNFTVVLNAQPGSNVVFTVESDDVTAATVAPTTLTFAPGTWDTPQPVTVTGVDDAIDDGDQTATVTVAVDDANSDDAFDGLADKTVAITTTDNDGAGITVVPTAITLAEGATDNFTVVLDARPTSSVTLNLTSSDGTEANAAPTSLTFTPGTWDTPKTVTVTGEDDTLDDGDQDATITVAVDDATSNAAFHGLQRVVNVTVTDTDTRPTAAIAAPSSGSTFAEGASVSFSGVANDFEDGVLSGGSLVWTSSLDGQIGTGTSFSTSSLSAGTHTITLTATDSDGWTGTDQITLTVNAYPVANITAPTNGSSYTQGDAVSFAGTGSDPEDGVLTGTSLVWTSNLSGPIGTGASFSRSNLPVGTHIITLTVTDSGGLVHTDQVSIAVIGANTPPTANITSPANGSSFVEGASVSFAGTGTDVEDGALTGTDLVWTSSRDGQIGTGTSFTRSDLSVGTHTITLTATDGGGAVGADNVSITVTNTAPTANITAPANGSSSTEGDAVSFAGTGSDTEDGALTGASLVWTSNFDGQIGTGTSFSTPNLSVNTHIITLTATDSGLLTGTDQISITVNANTAPTANITAPGDGSSSTSGDAVNFAGTGSDTEDGTLTGASLVWTSNHDGEIGTGTSFSKSNLSVNTHTITLTVTDSGGLDGTDQISITVSAPTPTIGLSTTTSGFAATTGGGNPSENTVTITNTGTGTLDGLSAGITYTSAGSGWLSATLDATTATTTLRLNATTGALAAGTYTADVDVASTASGVTNSPQTVAVTFIVSDPAPTPTIGLSTTTSGFAATTGGGNPSENTVTITNTGTGTLDGLSAGITYTSAGSGWLSATLDATTATTTLRLNATTGALAAGTYTADVDVASTASGVTNSPQTVAVTFIVSDPAPTPTIGLSTTTSGFAATTGGGNPSENIVTITNTGTGTLDGLSAGITYTSAGSGWLSATLDATTATTTLRLNATTGALAAGTYTADVDVASTASGVTNSPQTVAVTFIVSDPAPTPTIGLSTTTSGFAATTGGGNPSENTVTITNTGTGTLDGLSAGITYTSAGSGWLSATLDGTTATTTLRLNATTGALAAGIYTADVDVASTASGVTNSPQTVAVTFTVSDPAPTPTIGLSTTTSGFAATTGGGNPSENTVTITNTGTGTLDGLSAGITYTSAGSGWLSATLDGTTATTTLRLNATTGALAAGTYTADVDVASTASGVTNSPQTVAVTFTVTAEQVQLVQAPVSKADTRQRSAPTEATSTTR